MKHLIIRNVGPLKDVDVDFRQFNVIIGPQSSGKSCVLKIACYCSWVEKRIQIRQSPERFMAEGEFVKELVRFHKLHGFIREDSYIEYETDTMHFSYRKATDSFDFRWKDGRWDYLRSKISYIPAERNMVAVIPNWYDVKLEDNNIRSFMSDWEEARQAVLDAPILNLGVNYHYNSSTKKDEVIVSDDITLDLTNTSSGLQSLIPTCVFLQYLLDTQFSIDRKNSVSQRSENAEILKNIFEKVVSETGEQNIAQEDKSVMWHIGNHFVLFKEEETAKLCDRLYQHYSETHCCNIFLEEPEANLFPPTQSGLVDWLQDMIKGREDHSLFVATHSPYVVTSFLEKLDNDLAMFFIQSADGVVKAASEEDKQAIYESGFDAFYNLESLG